MNDSKKNKKSKKRIFLPDNKHKELEGFEEVLDLIDNNGIEVKKSKNEIQIEDYEIYDFLEKEVTRLDKLDQFFSVQMPIEKKYSQTRALIRKENQDIQILKEEILDNTSESFSGLSNYLDYLIRKSY